MSDTTHPGLAYLRARAAWDLSKEPSDHLALRLNREERWWRGAGCPIDLVPRVDYAVLAEDAERLAARVAACDAEILRLTAENRRLTRGVRGWVRAWLGAR